MTRNFRENGYSERVQYELYENIVQDINTSNEFSSEVSEKVFENLVEAVNSGCDAVAAAAFAYDRKGYLSTTSIDRTINTAYGTEDDDVLLQVTVRVPNYKVSELVTFVREEKAKKDLAKKEAEKIALDEEIERLKQKRAELD